MAKARKAYKPSFTDTLTTGEFPGCCGLTVLHGFPEDFELDELDGCEIHGNECDFNSPTCKPLYITEGDIVEQIDGYLGKPGSAYAATTNPASQSKAEAALRQLGWELVAPFYGNYNNRLNLWILQRAVRPKPAAKRR